MEQMDIFGAFGLTPFDAGEKKAEKKVNKETKKDANKKNTSSAKDFEVAFPLTVRARGFETSIESCNSNKVSDVISYLVENGFEELKMNCFRAFYDKDGNTLYFTLSQVACVTEDTLITLPVTVLDGEKKAVFDAEMFPDKDEDEITALDIADKFASINPEYQGCHLIYQGDYCYPVFSEQAIFKGPFPAGATVVWCGERTTVEEEISVDQYVTHRLGNGEIKAKVYHNLDNSCYFVSFFGGSDVKRNFDAATLNETKKAVEKYALPLKVHLSFGLDVTLEKEQFENKDKITLEDIKKHFSASYSIFKDTSRKMDAIYIKEENILDIAFVSGKKGAGVHEGEHLLFREKSDLLKLIKQGLYPKGNVINRDGTYRVESLPNGTFLVKINSETGKEVGLSFERRLPRIPCSVLNRIKGMFEADLSKEWFVSIFYHKPSQGWLIVQPLEVCADKTSISYEMDPNLLRDKDLVQVVQFHSHNTMPAIFSSTDDADEVLPLLYGVIGSLNHDIPQLSLRAGFNGLFCDVEPEIIFDNFTRKEWMVRESN